MTADQRKKLRELVQKLEREKGTSAFLADDAEPEDRKKADEKVKAIREEIRTLQQTSMTPRERIDARAALTKEEAMERSPFE